MPVIKTCTVCGFVGIKQVKGMCRPCYYKNRDTEHPEVSREYRARYNARHPGRMLAAGRKYQEANRDKINATANAKSRELKLAVIVAYGGKCECCGEDNPVFLTVDHIFNDGMDDRKSDHGGWRFYLRLKKLGYPKDRYRLLCYNCNLARGFWETCPHEDNKHFAPKWFQDRVRGSLSCVPDPLVGL